MSDDSSTGSSSDDSSLSEPNDKDNNDNDEHNNNIKVFLRLRPMNKLETSRRSKNCVDLPEDDPRCITVDSPLEGSGEYDFFFTRVFEEYASQEEVYQHSIVSVPTKLLEGYNCSVIAYGQTGTGKTHTLMGMQQQPQQQQSLLHTSPSRTTTSNVNDHVNPETEGMIVKTAHDVFEHIQNCPPTMEFTVRCSYVEIYLEKILDLLNPTGDTKLSIVEETSTSTAPTAAAMMRQGDQAAGVVAGIKTTNGSNGANVRILGAAELCCVDERDVCGLLARGNACRTLSSTEMNTDSSRSHAIFVMKVERRDTRSGMIWTSELQMVDLAGSEMASLNQGAASAAVVHRHAPEGANAVQVEAKMINKSLTALQSCIRAQLENQQREEAGEQPATDHGSSSSSVTAMSKQSKLTRLLRPSFGGNCMTWLILTASPSSYNIGETTSTIRFGQRAKRIENRAVVNVDYSREVYQKRLEESEAQRKAQMSVLKAVALECKRLKKEEARNDGIMEEAMDDEHLWNTIDELLASEDTEDLDFRSLVQGRSNVSDNVSVNSAQTAADELEKARREIQKLREQLESISQARDDADDQLSELESEVAVLRSQNEHLIADKTKDLEELINAKNELQIMSQRKIEVEHNFRTSQFRENEAIVFLRTFRRFYKNVLRDRAAHGSGSLKAIMSEVSEKVPGALDLDELVDADALLFEAGLVEEHEMRSDKKSAPVYIPSKAALIRSATNAKKAAKEMEELERQFACESTEDVAGAKASEEPSQSGTDETATKRASVARRRSSAIRRASLSSVDKPHDESQRDDPVDENERATSSEVVASRDSEKELGAGADAGAGSSTSTGPAVDVAADAGSLWDQSGIAITKRQQLLGTPAGRFSLMQEKNMESDLDELADKCIKLEQALKEERATVDMLSGRAGGVNKKKLAQEAIQLRQQIEKNTQNLMATAWKMNELNMINKSYNEKMVNREQHVIYLEENYVELQNRNRMIIEQLQEAERKLRDELESVQQVLGGMSVSLWQYNEGKPTEERSVARRIHIPVRGGNHSSSITEDLPKRRLSRAESEPSLDLSVERETHLVETVDSSTQTDDLKLEDAQMQTDLVEKHDVCVQTDQIPHDANVISRVEETLGSTASPIKSLNSVDASVQTDDQEVTGTALHPALGNVVAIEALKAVSSDDRSIESESEEDGERTPIVGVAASAKSTVEVRELAAMNAAGGLEPGVKHESCDEAEQSIEQSPGSVSDIVSAPSAVDDQVGTLDGSLISRSETSKDQSKDADSVDEIEAITGALAAADEVPETVALTSYESGDNISEDEGPDREPLRTGKELASGVTSAAVIAAASVVKNEEAEKKGTTGEPTPATDPKSKDSNADAFKAKNIFASSVFSVLNRGSSDKREEEQTKETSLEEHLEPEDGMESYHGDGHSPKRLDRIIETQSSRDEWAAARDDFDSIFEETAQAVNTSSLRRKPVVEEVDDPVKSVNEFRAIAAKIGHQNEEEIVTMGSKGQLGMAKEEIPRKPWETAGVDDKRKPWERSPKKGDGERSFGESYDVTKDSWYADSDDESNGSYRYETHVLNRPQTEETTRPSLVKFSGSTKMREKSASEDEFDQMMSATQAALGAAEGIDLEEEDTEKHYVPANDTASLTSKEEALFTGGRTNDFRPRRSVDRPKIRAGVLKEEKKPSRDKSRSDLIRKKSESRRKLGDGDERKRKKKDEKKKKKSGKSSRNLARSKSERHPKRDRDQPRSSRRRSDE